MHFSVGRLALRLSAAQKMTIQVMHTIRGVHLGDKPDPNLPLHSKPISCYATTYITNQTAVLVLWRIPNKSLKRNSLLKLAHEYFDHNNTTTIQIWLMVKLITGHNGLILVIITKAHLQRFTISHHSMLCCHQLHVF